MIDDQPDAWFGVLRRRAEEALRKTDEPHSGDDLARLVHDLEVHHVELSMQNEELRAAQIGLERLRAEYADLYEHAPVGYVTVDVFGRVRRANLAAAGLFDVGRNQLIDTSLPGRYDPADAKQLRLRFREALVGEVEPWETSRLRPDGKRVVIRHTVVQAEGDDGPELRLALTDVTDLDEARAALDAANRALHGRVERSERQLGERDAELRLIADNIPVQLVRIDDQERHVFVNRAYASFWGMKPSEVIGRTVLEVVGPDLYSEIRAHLRQAFDGTAVCYEHRFIWSGRGERWMETTYLPNVDERGRTTGLHVVVHDVTERRIAERSAHRLTEKMRVLVAERTGQLQESVRYHAALIAAIQEAVISTDLKGRILSWNESAETTLGWTAPEVIGRPFTEVLSLHPVDGERRPRSSSIDDLPHGLARLRHRDGGDRLLDISASLVRGPEGETAGQVVVARDVTARVAAQRAAAEALREERDFADGLVEIAPVIVLVLDAEGRVVRFNKFLEELSGFTLEEVRGQDWADTFGPEDAREAMRESFERSVRGSPNLGTVTSLKTKDGRRREIEWHESLLTGAKGLRGLLAIGRDITDERRLVREAQHAQKMEAVGTLAAGIAHDFNNLLMGIIGMAEMAENKLGEPEAANRYVAEIQKAARGGVAIVRQLLTFSKKASPTLRDMEVDEMVAAAAPMLRTLLGEDVELDVELRSDGGRILIAPGQLEQIMMNLAANARHAMPKGGTLSISTARVHIRADDVPHSGVRRGRYVRLVIRDTGVGMSEETRARAFEPFFTTKEEGGTGLGLSTTYGIVRAGSGHIEVESQPGVGTTFTILMPLVRPSQMGLDSKLEEDDSRVRSGTVLVVEDEELVRMTVCHYLESAGYRVLRASAGEEAMGLWRDNHVDVLLTDAVLPQIQGSDLIAAMRDEDPNLLVAVMSAHPRELLEQEGRIDKSIPSLQKPFTKHDLLRVVDRLAASRSASRSAGVVGGAEDAAVVLIVEDNATARAAVRDFLSDLGYEVLAAGTVAEAMASADSRISNRRRPVRPGASGRLGPRARGESARSLPRARGGVHERSDLRRTRRRAPSPGSRQFRREARQPRRARPCHRGSASRTLSDGTRKGTIRRLMRTSSHA